MSYKINDDGKGTEGQVHVCAHRVTYRYWDAENEITEEIAGEMEEEAEHRAQHCIASDGTVSGELNFLRTEPEEEIRGWWEIKRD